MARPPIAFDIETVGEEWDDFDDHTQDYLILRAQRKLARDGADEDGAEELARNGLGLSPGTGRIVVIGLANVVSNQGCVLYEGEGGWEDTPPGADRVFRGNEEEILMEFWKLLENYGRSITYNGRGFDVPYLYIRSALYGLRPSRHLLGNRYSVAAHCDLAEVLTFFGASHERFTLDFWCRKFDITSPKEAGLDGSKVGEYYDDGRIDEIADYCLRDCRATADLYKALEGTIIDLYSGR